MFRATGALLLILVLTFGSQAASAQVAPASANLPSFGAATIKPPGPGSRGLVGFYGDPGGRVFFGGTLKMLVYYAFNLQNYQISGGPGWMGSQWFEINAVLLRIRLRTKSQCAMRSPPRNSD